MVSFTIVEPPLAENGISSALRAVFYFYFRHLTLCQDIRAAESFPFGLL